MSIISHFKPQGFSIYTLATETYPMDLVSGATAGFSLRKLRSAYTGNCIKIRRSTDDATLDVGFAGYYLDFQAIQAFIGNNSAFIDTWYDQSGNGRNVVQATTALQPQFINAGIYYLNIGNYPCIDFSSGNKYLESSGAQSTFITTTAGTAFQLWNADTISGVNDGNAIWGNRGGWNGVFIKNVSGVINIRFLGYDGNEDWISLSTYAADISYVTVWQHANAMLYSYIKSATAIEGIDHGTETDLSAKMVVGRDIQTTVGSAIFDGRQSELIIYNTGLSDADLETVGVAMSTPYGLTFGPKLPINSLVFTETFES